MKKILSVTLVLAVVSLSCTSMMLKVGEMAAKAMQEKSGIVADATPFVKLMNYNRPRPLLQLERDYATKMGYTDTTFGSCTYLMLARGMKFIEVDGVVKCNDADMDYLGSGTYIYKTDLEPGQTYTFYIKGTGEAETFEETYSGQTLEILTPAAGDSVSLADGFEITWTPGEDPDAVVKVSMFISQMGIQNVVPIGLFKDTGQARISPALIAEVHQPATTIEAGANVIVVERQKEEVQYILNGDGIVASVDADVVSVTVGGEAAKPKKPVIEAVKGKVGKVEVALAAVNAMYNPALGLPANVADIEKVGLSSFVFKGRTQVSETNKEIKTGISASGQVGTYIATVQTVWSADLGEDFLDNMVDQMADMFMNAVVGALGAEETPVDVIMNTKGYQRMRTVEQKSDPVTFYITGRNTTSFDGLRQMRVRIGGTYSWYYDMLRASDTDLLLELYVDLNRQKPKEDKVNEFTFQVNAAVDSKIFPVEVVMPFTFPSATAKWMSESMEITDATTTEDFIKAIQWQDFIDAYVQALQDYKAKQAALAK